MSRREFFRQQLEEQHRDMERFEQAMATNKRKQVEDEIESMRDQISN
jgi:hypothetical protein